MEVDSEKKIKGGANDETKSATAANVKDKHKILIFWNWFWKLNFVLELKILFFEIELEHDGT